jgi:nitrogen fixation/metabolism regulation signal transduction histidine kinase
MTTKVWNLMYALGNTGRVMGDAGNPQIRSKALNGAAVIDQNGWRVWVEHNTTKERVFENEREKAFRETGTDPRKVASIRPKHVPSGA